MYNSVRISVCVPLVHADVLACIQSYASSDIHTHVHIRMERCEQGRCIFAKIKLMFAASRFTCFFFEIISRFATLSLNDFGIIPMFALRGGQPAIALFHQSRDVTIMS